jgi:phospholipid transport system substrate-binding protein
MTKITIPKDEDVLLYYKMRKADSGWRVIDVLMNGTVSEIALRRSDFSSILKRDGFDELAAAVERKIADLKAKSS